MFIVKSEWFLLFNFLGINTTYKKNEGKVFLIAVGMVHHKQTLYIPSG